MKQKMKQKMKHLDFGSESDFKIFIEAFHVICSEKSTILCKKNSQSPIFIYKHISWDQQSVISILNQLNHNQINSQQFNLYINQSLFGQLFIFPPHCEKHYRISEKNTLYDELMRRLNSQSIEIKKMLDIIQKVAKTDFPVLVRGESGSGKEWVVQLIHECSMRSEHAFIAINCAALNENILESELFGHVKGAFTGAIKDHKGLFERAKHGTLFLDEIAELSLNLQAKLLRVLETGEFTPVGGETVARTQARIITATHKSLRDEAKHGRFRYDLLYRLRVIPIFVPPLRDRKEDIPLLVDHITSHYSIGTPNKKLTDHAMSILIKYDWPGNIRELKNTLLYALTMADDLTHIDIQHLPQELISENMPNDRSEISDSKLSKTQLAVTLAKTNYNLNETCDLLKISRTTLWRHRKKWSV